jgi:hypothetical protein
MNLPDNPQPSSFDSLAVQRSASIFQNILTSTMAKESPFTGAPFLIAIAEKYLKDNNQSSYFTTKEGFGANIIIREGIAEPNIDLNIQEGLKSRILQKRISIRIGKENLTNEEIFQFAVGHELGHLIQGIPDYETVEDYDLTNMTEVDINVLRWKLDRHNKSISENKEIIAAQIFFRSIFKEEVNSEYYIPADIYNYTDEEYLKYVNSESEANADFIALWIMGMRNPNMKTSPQNEGYSLSDWQKWTKDHRIDMAHIA